MAFSTKKSASTRPVLRLRSLALRNRRPLQLLLLITCSPWRVYIHSSLSKSLDQNRVARLTINITLSDDKTWHKNVPLCTASTQKEQGNPPHLSIGYKRGRQRNPLTCDDRAAMMRPPGDVGDFSNLRTLACLPLKAEAEVDSSASPPPLFT